MDRRHGCRERSERTGHPWAVFAAILLVFVAVIVFCVHTRNYWHSAAPGEAHARCTLTAGRPSMVAAPLSWMCVALLVFVCVPVAVYDCVVGSLEDHK